MSLKKRLDRIWMLMQYSIYRKGMIKIQEAGGMKFE